MKQFMCSECGAILTTTDSSYTRKLHYGCDGGIWLDTDFLSEREMAELDRKATATTAQAKRAKGC